MLPPSSGSDCRSYTIRRHLCSDEDSIRTGHVTLVVHDSILPDSSEVPEPALYGMGPN